MSDITFAVPDGSGDDVGWDVPSTSEGPQGPPGVVAATAPLSYDAGTKTVGLAIDNATLGVIDGELTAIGAGGLSASLLVADADLSGGTVSSFDLVDPSGTVTAAGVPRSALVGVNVAVLSGDDGGGIYTVTASGACTLVAQAAAGQLLSVFSTGTGGGIRYVMQASNADGPGGTTVAGEADRFVRLSSASIDGLDDALNALDGSEASGVAAGQVLADTAPYLKVGRSGVGDHEAGAFECTDDFDFDAGLDVRVWFRTMSAPGAGSFCELVTQTADAGVGTVDAYELAFFVDGDGAPRLFAEHIKTGESAEQDPKPLSAPHSVGYGAIFGARHTIDYTGGAGGVGVERLYLATATDPDVVTADGIGWRQIAEVVHDGVESVKDSYTEPWWIGASEHESHVFIVQMFDGIDGAKLVDLHAADATSATTITCREGTVWAAVDTATIENLPPSGGGSNTRTKVLATAETASSDTLVNSALSLSVEASSRYAFEYHGRLDATAVRDAKILLVGPSGSTVVGSVHGLLTNEAGVPAVARYLGDIAGGAVSTGTVAAGTVVPVTVHGSIITGATAGDLTVQFAQSSNGSGDVTHNVGSRLIVTKETT